MCVLNSAHQIVLKFSLVGGVESEMIIFKCMNVKVNLTVNLKFKV